MDSRTRIEDALPSDTITTLPRPWSRALEEVLQRDYPSHTFKEAMGTLFLEFEKNYSGQRSNTHLNLPQTPRSLNQRQTASVSPGVSKPPGHTRPSDDSLPHQAANTGQYPVYNITSGSGTKRKRRAYSPAEKEQVNQTRKRGACDKCHRSHKKCNHSLHDESIAISGPDPGTPGEVSREISFNLYLPTLEGKHQPNSQSGIQVPTDEDPPEDNLDHWSPNDRTDIEPNYKFSSPLDFNGLGFPAPQNFSVPQDMELFIWPQATTEISTGLNFVPGDHTELNPRRTQHRHTHRRPASRPSFPGHNWAEFASDMRPPTSQCFG